MIVRATARFQSKRGICQRKPRDSAWSTAGTTNLRSAPVGVAGYCEVPIGWAYPARVTPGPVSGAVPGYADELVVGMVAVGVRGT
jgi:hypothetical protein